MKEDLQNALEKASIKASITEGPEKTFAVLKRHWEIIEEKEEKNDIEWRFSHFCKVLTDPVTGEIFAIEGSGEGPAASSLFLIGYLVPHFDYCPGSVEDLYNACVAAIDCYKTFLLRVEKNTTPGKKPLMLLNNIWKNEYLAYDLTGGPAVNVNEYKEYRKDFLVDGKSGAGEYEIHKFSDEEIKALSFERELIPEIWRNNLVWDKPEKMPEHEALTEEVPMQHRLVYKKAVELINIENNLLGSRKNHECARELEDRTKRYERMLLLGAPDIAVEQAFRLIGKSIESFKS